MLTIVIFTVAEALVATQSDTVKVKLSGHVYPSAGRYVNAHVEVTEKTPCIGSVVAVKERLPHSISDAVIAPM